MARPDRSRSVASIVPLAALLALALGGSSAPAADKKTAGATKTPLLSQAQLRDCLAKKDKMAKDSDAALKSKAAIAAEKAEIDSAGTALAEQATTLDRTSAEAVNEYNAKVEQRNARIDAYQAKVTAYNAEAEAVLTAKEAYEKACANRRYDDRDLNDLQRKK